MNTENIASTLSVLGVSSDSFSISGIIAGILFSFVGLFAFMRGKKAGEMKTLVIGISLMVYPYFVSNPFWAWTIGIALCVALYFFRGE